MAIKISRKEVLPEHQVILDSAVVIAATVMDMSGRAKKGTNQIDFPTLAPRTGQRISVGGSLSTNPNNYGSDVVDLDQVVGDRFFISDHDESDNVLNALADGLEQTLKAMAKQLDAYLYSLMLAAATFSEVARTADFYNDIVDLSAAMDAAQIPAEDRYLLVTPADYAILLKTKDFVRFDSKGDGSAISSGNVGEVLGFKVIRANAAGVTETIAYHKVGAVWGWHREQVLKKTPDSANMGDDYSLSRKMGAKALQSGAFIYKFGVTP